jgi:hypothetical protein
MFRKLQGMRRTAPQQKVKLVKPQTSALKMSKRVKKTALPKGVGQVVSAVISQLTKARGTRLARAATQASVVSSAAPAVGVAVVAALVVMLLVLTFLVWGIVRSGQEMNAGSADVSASKLYFWFMIGLTIAYAVMNIVASAVTPSTADIAVTTAIMSGSPADGLSVAQDKMNKQNAANTLYSLGSVTGLAVLIMSIVALVRLGMKKR